MKEDGKPLGDMLRHRGKNIYLKKADLESGKGFEYLTSPTGKDETMALDAPPEQLNPGVS